ncbi:MAG: hypothetical protein QOK21_2858 [Solirubrobacteraceae bacterium]|jgi:hypothetical protein|nr:hypothetical protein [Solirubrobacteraceae bacterium]
MAAQGWATTGVEYLQQSLDDADVRKNLARGVDAIRQATRQAAGRPPTTKAAKKTTLRRKLRDAVLSLGRAGAAAREAEHKRARAQRRRRVLLLVVGASVGIGLGAPARNKASGLLGGEQDVPDQQGGSPPQPSVGPT